MAGSAWLEKTWKTPDGKKIRAGDKPSKDRVEELTTAGFELVGAPYFVGWREPGTTKKKYQSFRTLDEARRERTKIEDKLQSGRYIPAADRKEALGAYLERMLESSRDIAPSTAAWYRQHYDVYVRESLGHLPIGSITKEHLEGWITEQGFGNGTIHAVRQLLAKTFNSALREGVIGRSPLAGVKFPKRTRKEIEPLPVEVIEGLADAIEPRYRAAVLLAGYGGLRGGEVGGLQLQDMNLDGDAPTVTIKQAIRTVGGRAEIAEPKSAAARRRVNIPRFLANELRQHVEEFGSADDGRIFTTSTGGLVSHFTLNKALGKAADKIALPKPRFHDLRHTCAALMIGQGAHPKVIQARMGHSTITITMDVYGSLFPSLDEELARGLDSMRTKVLAAGSLPALEAEIVEP